MNEVSPSIITSYQRDKFNVFNDYIVSFIEKFNRGKEDNLLNKHRRCDKVSPKVRVMQRKTSLTSLTGRI